MPRHHGTTFILAGHGSVSPLQDLALSGFVNIDVIDMDTIDVSNLNRQFLFRCGGLYPILIMPPFYDMPCLKRRTRDVGKPKATVAAERINARVSGVTVTPHHCRIEEMPAEW